MSKKIRARKKFLLVQNYIFAYSKKSHVRLSSFQLNVVFMQVHLL